MIGKGSRHEGQKATSLNPLAATSQLPPGNFSTPFAKNFVKSKGSTAQLSQPFFILKKKIKRLLLLPTRGFCPRELALWGICVFPFTEYAPAKQPTFNFVLGADRALPRGGSGPLGVEADPYGSLFPLKGVRERNDESSGFHYPPASTPHL
ncbi:hypothetical protein JTE90_026918 [Oedothorax gibbosus]|uniref:Uncharacterized protein n=1 Tax=Oedothorax gibbosus TaxID=931172 RepID=A0AAV6TD36_9ARAC|nr:hypothetical protein JTE90_026918 [Oedothorax gibbosus]